METSIHALSKDTINQIAAGEVVERPSQIIKELVENAIDAQAQNIEVEFDEGGRFIKVRDDGLGIPKDQMSLALSRHATSKIQGFDDLWKLKTYGFRGEALASISSVSDLTLISKTEQAPTSYKLQLCFGSEKELEPTGGSRGTTVIVQSLFENTPARFKFLKSSASESVAIKQTLKAMALSHTSISFRILSKGKLLFYWPAQDSLKKRAQQILGLQDLYFLQEKQGKYTISAVVAAPHNTLKTRRSSWVFVMDRWVECRVIQAAFMSAYRGLLMHGEYPIAVIKLEGPSDEIDVNVHPTKSQIRFQNNSLIFKLVESSIRKILEEAPWTQKIGAKSKEKEENLSFHQAHFQQTQFPKKETFFSKESLSQLAWKPPEGEGFSKEAASSPATFQERKPWSSLQILAQAHLTYLVCQSNEAIFFIDQHAAHERVIYETLFQSFKSGNRDIQKQLVPVSLNLEDDEVEALLSLRPNLEKFGVQLEQLGPSVLAVTSAPVFLKEKSLQEGLLLLARKFIETRDCFAFENVMSNIFATMACHSAIRAGQSLSQEQMKELLHQMDQFPLSSFCPHGRPVFVEYSISQLERDFCRKV